jgi:hypothetical protein
MIFFTTLANFFNHPFFAIIGGLATISSLAGVCYASFLIAKVSCRYGTGWAWVFQKENRNIRLHRQIESQKIRSAIQKYSVLTTSFIYAQITSIKRKARQSFL